VQLRKEARPMSLALDEQRQRLYASTGRGGTVAVIDLAKSQLITEIAVGARPWGMALSRDGKRLYTANGPSNDVSVVDTTTQSVVARIKVGLSPWGVVIGPSPAKQPAAPSAAAATPGSPALFLQSTAAARFTFYLSKLLGEPLGFVGVTEDAAALARQRCVLGERTGLDELVVVELCGDAVDRAGALVQAGELPAVRRNAIVHVLDPSDGRVIVGGRIGGLVGTHRGGCQEADQQGSACDQAGVA
jgi:YVTN family beta-propeller protein